MFKFNNKIILILSPEDWGDNLLSKHLYAQELSKSNSVYFLHTSPHPLQNNFIEVTSINSSLTIIHLKKVVKGIFKLPFFLIDLQNKIIIKKISKFINQTIDVVWSFDQSKFQNLKDFNSDVTIFHPVDYIEKARPFINRIANSAEYVFSVSQMILDQIETTTKKYFINHGLDEVFLKEQKGLLTPKYIDADKINVGYVGNLQMKLIDWENIINIIEQNSQLNFVFIGPESYSNIGGKNSFGHVEKIKKYSNTFFTGPLSKLELQKTLPFFDIFLICYNHKEFPIEVSNSHKILEYLSTGKIIVSSYIDTYKDSDLLKMENNNSLLPQLLQEVCKNITKYNSNNKYQERVNFVNENTYKNQILKIEKLINQ